MSFLYIANWKNFLLPDQELMLAQEYYDGLSNTDSNTHVVVMPSLLTVRSLAALYDTIDVSVGAQNCSAFNNGAYTGEISAQAIAQAGCNYALTGHIERRTIFGETDRFIAQKVEQLVMHNVTPILCISDTHIDSQESLYDTLKRQLELPLAIAHKYQLRELLVAYEPATAIGNGNTAAVETISEVFTLIKKLFTAAPQSTPVLLYGGSVNAKNCHQLKKIPHLGGFLIGSASTTFATFEKIVHSH